MTRIRVMSYNVGHYNMGLSSHGMPDELVDEKTAGLKEMLMEYAPDLIGIQEEEKWFDQAHEKKASAWLYSPVWCFRGGYDCTTIRAKYKAVSGSYVLDHYSNGMTYRHGIFKVDGRQLLAVSTHAASRTGNWEARLQQYRELFAFARSVECDGCVICGDFNTTDPEDRDNLTALCAENGFSQAIGSYLPWVDTYLGRKAGAKRHSFDNILAGPGMVITTTKVLRDWWDRLYSDHVPVVADVDWRD